MHLPENWLSISLHCAGTLPDNIAAMDVPPFFAASWLIGEWIAQLASQAGNGTTLEGVRCPGCGQLMVYKGDDPCTREHLEGEIRLQRAYYFCPECKQKIFPLDARLQLGTP
jgi:hypothetical protein